MLVFVIAVLALTTWFALAPVAAAGPWFVSPAGNDANDCQSFATACLTVVAAVGKASAGDIIIIASGIYSESITIGKDLTLIGFGSDETFLSGGDLNRVLEVSAGSKVNVYDLTVEGGYGGILNYGILMLSNSVVSDNIHYGGIVNNRGQLSLNYTIIGNNNAVDGGGIMNILGNVSLNHSTIISNSVNEFGAGVDNDAGNLSVNNTVITGNLACNQACPFFGPPPPNTKIPVTGYSAEGGGIFSSGGALTITNSTISNNTVMYGDSGGVYNGSAAVISNTTISGNIASVNAYAAGVNNYGGLALTNVTLSDNVGGGLRGIGPATVRNTIINNGECAGPGIISLGDNLSSDSSCTLNATGDMTNTNPLLGPLQDNGGPTPTHALLSGSPAINHGHNVGCPATDQRGIARPQAGVCDIGAYEYVFPDTLFMPLVAR